MAIPRKSTNGDGEISEKSAIWLHAWYDPLASLNTSASLLKLADLYSDGDLKLLICDINRKLMKVYKGTNLLIDNQILDTPVALAITYSDHVSPRIASVCVAAGQHVFLYRHLRPYKKWSCPSVELSHQEKEVWKGIQSGSINSELARNLLNEMR